MGIKAPTWGDTAGASANTGHLLCGDVKCARLPTLGGLLRVAIVPEGPLSQPCDWSFFDILKVSNCYRTRSVLVWWSKLVQRRKKEVNGCVGIAIKALLMHLCSNNHRTWEECSQLLGFFLPNQQLCEWAVKTGHTCPLLHLGPPVAFNGFKMLNSVELMVPLADQIHTKLFHPAPSLHCNGV